MCVMIHLWALSGLIGGHVTLDGWLRMVRRVVGMSNSVVSVGYRAFTVYLSPPFSKHLMGLAVLFNCRLLSCLEVWFGES